MTTNHRTGVVRRLVRHIRKNYPEVPLILRPVDIEENRLRGYVPGQPDILVLEKRCRHIRYIGLAIWATSWTGMTKPELRFRSGLASQSFETVASDDYNDLRLQLMTYVVGLLGWHWTMGSSEKKAMRTLMESVDTRMEDTDLRAIEAEYPDSDNPVRELRPLTGFDYRVLSGLTESAESCDPSAVVIPGLGVGGQPDLTIISPSIGSDGLAIWLSFKDHRGRNPLSVNQLTCLKGMASRSYEIAVTSYATDAHDHFRDFMINKFPPLE